MEQSASIAWSPTPDIVRDANWTAFARYLGLRDYQELEQQAAARPEWFWEGLIKFIGVKFYNNYDRLLDLSDGLPNPKWCVGGTTNFVLTALDAHLDETSDQPCISFHPEVGAARRWTYGDLAAEVSRAAAGLQGLGLRKGDVVGLYMPMIPEAVAAFLAIAKLGCTALPLFSGFGPEALAARMKDGGAKAAVTVDATTRRGQPVAMKSIIAQAAASVSSLRHLIVVRNRGEDVEMVAGRDVWWHDMTDGQPDSFPTAEVEAEHPLLMIYTSGTTGRPKGIVHNHVGFTAKMGLDTRLGWDINPGNNILYVADMGWLGGPMFIAAGLLNQARITMIEGVPDYPQPDRLWRLVEQERVTLLGLAPTMARMARQANPQGLSQYDLSSLRSVAVSAEPIDPKLWTWIFETICGGTRPIFNFSGGTEIGTIVTSNIVSPMKPAAFNGGIPGTAADIVDGEGKPVGPGEVGELVMRGPCLGRAQMVWRDPARYIETYWSQIPGVWTQGDWASRDADGYWYLHGRSDDTIKVAGKRTGPAEVEAALLSDDAVLEAAVVGLPDPDKGAAVVCVVVPKEAGDATDGLAAALRTKVVERLGASFRPSRVLFVDELPKTRTGKIMRRLVRDVLLGNPPSDTSSLANPDALTKLGLSKPN